MDTVVDRLIRYAKVYSESDYHAGRTVTPSTDRQFDMAKLLVEELHGLGIENARYDDKCYVYATLDATPGCEQLPAIGLIAHMDTTPDMTGKDVKPQIIHYTGGDVVLNREQTLAGALVETVEKAGNTGMFLSPREALSLITDRSLLIIVDTHSESFVESRDLYKYSKRTVVIDHHRMMVKHIENAIIFYHEPYASSASEMVTELVQYLGENAIGRLEADALLAGITLDTKNFVLKTGVRTFEAAAFLRRKGADTVEVKRLFSNSIDTYRAKYQLVSNAEIYNSCAVTAADEDCPDIRIASAQAADELLGVQGVNASFVLYSSAGTVNISARSLGAVNVQVVMEKLGGGGHQTMAGAQLKDTTVTAVRERLIEILNETQIHKENL